MMTFKILLVVILLFLQEDTLAIKPLKLIYEKDVSEHCRRRVVPSIFLGRQVIEANSRILQFSRLELPYSCYISIRTESGSSMVMMLQVTSDEVNEACKHSGQLLVYEMGETFGGYWGPLPESAMRPNPQPAKPYTLRTTHVTKSTTESTTEEEETTETTEPSTASSSRPSESSSGDYVEVEVPLLNVSVRYVPAKEIQLESLDTVDTFDLDNDVTPIQGAPYDRTIVPLVQFRIVQQPRGGPRRNDAEGDPPKYELDIVQDFTPDTRLTLPPEPNPTSKRRHKQRYQTTRRLNFKKHRTLFHSQRQSDRRVMSETITRKINDVTKYSFPTTRNISNDKLKHTQDSWRVVEDLLKKLNKTTERSSKTTLSLKEAQILERISDMDHNKSVYLSSNLSQYGSNNYASNISTSNAVLSTWDPVSSTSIPTQEYESKFGSSILLRIKEPTKDRNEMKSATVEDITTELSKSDQISQSTEIITERFNTEGSRTDQKPSVVTIPIMNDIQYGAQQTDEVFGKSSVSEIQSDIPIETTSTSSSTETLADSKNKFNNIVTGSMVGHESWENLVQAAPEMAVLLNQSVDDVINRGNTSDDKILKRKKKDIHSIAIENAQPHSITTRETLDTTTQQSFDVADMQEFAQLVELEDDELHGRVALRHLHQFVGPPLFNLCDIPDPSKPHVHLFNSSRIVLSPTNFTLDRLVIILTAARALLNGELRCPKAKIECQVSGARVCLDSMVACDSVPNCGSYDIYDEDRLMCGHTASLQHNVYLAAFTFLAVLLTIIYAVHYWLKRCVPQVADAFFVYSDGIENILYLDSIMRSPHDMGEEPKMVYHSHMYGEDIYDDVTEHYKNACHRCLRMLCCCCRNTGSKKHETETSISTLNLSMPRKMYSFTELEIRKMIASSKDTAVQTGDSLEMRPVEYGKDKKTVHLTDRPLVVPKASSYDFTAKVANSLLTLEEPLPEDHTDELSLLKFLKAARTQRSSSADLQMDFSASPKQPPPKKKSQESRMDSPSEKEIEIHSYDRYGLSEPGPSKRKDDMKDERPIRSSSSVNKHLRFEEVTTTIPAGRYADGDDDTGANVEGRRTVVLGEKTQRSSRILDTIEEADEQGTKEHRYFWGKVKKQKKKGHLSLR